jgi:hypothetical protein
LYHDPAAHRSCTFSGNSAGAAGGASWNGYDRDLTVVNCTFPIPTATAQPAAPAVYLPVIVK